MLATLGRHEQQALEVCFREWFESFNDLNDLSYLSAAKELPLGVYWLPTCCGLMRRVLKYYGWWSQVILQGTLFFLQSA